MKMFIKRIRVLRSVVLLRKICKAQSCVKCRLSYGTNAKKLSCEFLIRPRDINMGNAIEFLKTCNRKDLLEVMKDITGKDNF